MAFETVRLSRSFLFVIIAVVATAAGACSSGSSGADEGSTPEVIVPTSTRSASTQPTPTTASGSTATPSPGGSDARVETPAAVATQLPPTVAPPSGPDGPNGALKLGIGLLPEVRAIRYLTAPGPDGAMAASQGSIHEFLFDFKDGDPMGPMLATSWSLNDSGTVATITLRDDVPWISPAGFENIDFGVVEADDVVEMILREHPTFNPDSVSFQGGDLAATIQNMRTIDESTLAVDLVAPLYFCLPFSRFGCLGAGMALERVKGVDEMGEDWAVQNRVGTGPFRQGVCIANDRCTVHAVENHWRKTPSISESTLVLVSDPNVGIANMKTGAIDVQLGIAADIAVELVTQDGMKWIEVPGEFVGQSLAMSGNLWEEFHGRTGEPLNPWDSDAYSEDFAWIGDPWQESHPDKVRYTDTNNPPGMTDMEQARLVRLALSIGLNRGLLNEVILGGIGAELYSEYMGPFYQGWDPERSTGVWNVDGERIDSNGTQQSVPWKIEFDPDEANRLLDLAGFPKDGSGNRSGIGKITIDGGNIGEMGNVNRSISDAIASDWERLGVNVEIFERQYRPVVTTEMRERNFHNMILKNGDVHSNVLPLDHPLPPVDTSITRPGWGMAFESEPGTRWFFEIVSERDKAAREKLHLDWVDYSLYWLQYIGVYQFPKGIVVGSRVESFDSPVTAMFNNDPIGLEYLVLSDG